MNSVNEGSSMENGSSFSYQYEIVLGLLLRVRQGHFLNTRSV